MLCSAPVLDMPDTAKGLILQVASGHAVGACVSQIGEDGQKPPVAYASQKLKSSQSKWSFTEKEAYAVIWTLKRFEFAVWGSN